MGRQGIKTNKLLILQIFLFLVATLNLYLVRSESVSNLTVTSCEKPFQTYAKCAVPQIRFGNCSLTAAMDKLRSIVKRFDWKFKLPPRVTVYEQAKKAGYTAVEHKVTTKDGYILGAFRIQKDDTPPTNCSRRPIVLRHGASTHCASWTLPSTDDGIVWRLVAADFDVWLTCARSTIYSTSHVRLTTSQPAYWDFDIDDLGSDEGRWIDYILGENVTGCPNLSFVAHSMGTAAMFSLFTLQPEYNAKVNHYFAISAAAFQSYTTNVIAPVASLECSHLLVGNLVAPNGYSVNAPFPGRLGRQLFHNFMPYICGASEAQGFICGIFSFVAFGCQFENTNYTMLANSVPYFLDNLSIKAYRHASQNIAMKRFCRFDYGAGKNLKMYDSCEPPCYDMSRVTTNVTIFELSNDAPVGHKDVVKLMESLDKVENKMVVRVPGMRNHLDLLIGNNPKFYVDTIIQRLAQ